MILVSANLGRGVGAPEFRANVRRIKNRFGNRAAIGFQEIDEADQPNEHKIIKDVFGKNVTWAGWSTHVPIMVPPPFAIRRRVITKAAPGLPKLSPARQVVESEIWHTKRGVLDPFVLLNVHFPRKHQKLNSRRNQTMEALKERVDYWHCRGRTVLITADANGMNLNSVHPRARRIGGKGIDWIVLVEHPRGTQVNVKDTGQINLSIDGHNAHWVKFGLSRPKSR